MNSSSDGEEEGGGGGRRKEEAELRKFSSSRSKEVARFLKLVARACISRRSAPAESRRREMKEKAFSAATGDVDRWDGSVTGLIISGGVGVLAFRTIAGIRVLLLLFDFFFYSFSFLFFFFFFL